MTLEHTSTAIPRHLREVDRRLARIQEDRENQLSATPRVPDDPAVVAYRASLEATLRDVRFARERVAADDYGTCPRCKGSIAAERLELRPWVPTCAPCAGND